MQWIEKILKRPEARYVAAVGCVSLLFTHFIACGAQMYRARVDDEPKIAGIPEGARDPSSPMYGIHAPGGWSQIPIRYSFESMMTKEQKEGIKRAIAVWETAVGRKLFEFIGESNKRGDDFPDLFSSLRDSINGYYLDFDWKKTGKSDVVLATAIWSYSGSDAGKVIESDIRYNRSEYIPCDAVTLSGCKTKGVDAFGKSETTKLVYDMTSVAIHELGHHLGLLHTDESVDARSIMTPSMFIGEGLAQRTISQGDVQRIRRIYPAPANYLTAEDVVKEIQKNANRGSFALTEEQLSH